MRNLHINLGRAAVSLLIAFVVAAVLAGGAALAATRQGAAPDLAYKSLDYDVRMLPNGDLHIAQRVTMTMRERKDDDGNARPWRQLYQRYTLDPGNLTGITGISVRDERTGRDYARSQPIPTDQVSDTPSWDAEHAEHWYIANVDDEGNLGAYQPTDGRQEVEIGWNIPETTEDAARVFDITMTFEGVSTAYHDVTSFMWEPFGERNQVPIGVVTGNVRFPGGIDAGNSWAWLHYSGVSRTSRADDGSLRFTARDVRAGQHLDLVAMVDSKATSDVTRRGEGAAKQRIMADEARQEKAARDSERTAARVRLAAWSVAAALTVALGIVCIRAAILTYRDSQYHGDLDYWREPPELSPASAAKLNGVLEDVSEKNVMSRQLAATMLSLASRKAIAIYPGPVSLYNGVDLLTADPATVADAGRKQSGDSPRQAGETSTVVILPAAAEFHGHTAPSQSEAAALDFLRAASHRLGSQVFDLRQLQESVKGWSEAGEVQGRFATAAGNEFAFLGVTRSEHRGLLLWGTLETLLGVMALAAAVFIGPLAVWLGIGSVAALAGTFSFFYGRYVALTDHGQQLSGQVLGLKRYLTDFSSFADRGVNDLTLWDRYLVYAAAFGISRRVLDELAKSYPQVADRSWLDANASGSLLYWSYRPWIIAGAVGAGRAGVPGGIPAGAFAAGFGDLGGQLTASFDSIQATVRSASNSGFSGGGFSGGGFSGGGGGSGGGSFGGR